MHGNARNVVFTVLGLANAQSIMQCFNFMRFADLTLL